MELVNTTGIPAELIISELECDDSGVSIRAGTLVAKTTWEVRPSGLVLADCPVPVLRMEEPVELGFLPRDVVPPRPPGLDLVVLAAAYPPGGHPVAEMTVSLDVGSLHHELAVTGDRLWNQSGDSWVLGPAAPFVRMPLTWERAFGGTAEVWLDPASPVDVSDPSNPVGRGFDPSAQVHALAHTLGAAEGFPRLAYERLAPNVESPSTRVSAPEDAPEPCCWAPLPIDMGLRAKWTMEGRGMLSIEEGLERLKPGAPSEALRFAHRDLRIPVPAAGTPIVLSGCTPSGSFGLHWPQFRIASDYLLGSRRGVRHLEPLSCVLMPDRGLVTVTCGTWFRFTAPAEHEERSIRLRLES